MKAKVNLWILSLFTLFSCHQVHNEPQKTEPHQQHEDLTMYTMQGLEHGLIQSPVNILTLNTAEHIEHDIKIFQNDTTMSHELINTGHSVKLKFDAGTSIQFNGKIYRFIQAHFHTPSEHQIDGIEFDIRLY